MSQPSQRPRKRARAAEVFREFAWRIAGALQIDKAIEARGTAIRSKRRSKPVRRAKPSN